MARVGVTWHRHPWGRSGPAGGVGRVLRGVACAARRRARARPQRPAGGRRVRRAAGRPFVWDMRAFFREDRLRLGTLRPGSVEDRWLDRIERRLGRTAHGIVTLAEAAVPVLAERHGGAIRQRIEVIPTCVDLERFVPSPLPPGSLRLGLVGTLNRLYAVPAMLHLASTASATVAVVAPGPTVWDRELAAAGVGRRSATTDEMPGIVAAVHAGLCVARDPSPAAMPTKIGEFLAVGPPGDRVARARRHGRDRRRVPLWRRGGPRRPGERGRRAPRALGRRRRGGPLPACRRSPLRRRRRRAPPPCPLRADRVDDVRGGPSDHAAQHRRPGATGADPHPRAGRRVPDLPRRRSPGRERGRAARSRGHRARCPARPPRSAGAGRPGGAGRAPPAARGRAPAPPHAHGQGGQHRPVGGDRPRTGSAEAGAHVPRPCARGLLQPGGAAGVPRSGADIGPPHRRARGGEPPDPRSAARPPHRPTRPVPRDLARPRPRRVPGRVPRPRDAAAAARPRGGAPPRRHRRAAGADQGGRRVVARDRTTGRRSRRGDR